MNAGNARSAVKQRILLGTNTLLFRFIVGTVARARDAIHRSLVPITLLLALHTFLPIEPRLIQGTPLAGFSFQIIDEILWAVFAGEITEIKILRMKTLQAGLAVPEGAIGALALLRSRIVISIAGTLLANVLLGHEVHTVPSK